ncbi:MAG TPA: hypothetical protein VF807_00810, partial [Ktedonobacterales bacterium]
MLLTTRRDFRASRMPEECSLPLTEAHLAREKRETNHARPGWPDVSASSLTGQLVMLTRCAWNPGSIPSEVVA